MQPTVKVHQQEKLKEFLGRHALSQANVAQLEGVAESMKKSHCKLHIANFMAKFKPEHSDVEIRGLGE